MVSSRFVLTFPATLLILVIAGSSYAQAPIQPLGIDIINARSLTEAQKKRVEVFTRYWCRELTSADTMPEKVEAAREELLKPLNSVAGPSPVFRFEYSGQILPRLTPLITSDGSPHSASNAFLVLGELASRRSIDLMVRHSDSRYEKRLYIRILASQNCEKTLVYFSNALKPREIGSAVRGLRNAAQREENPTVLGHQLGGIQAIQTPEAMDALIDALKKVVEKIQAHDQGINPHIKPFSKTVKIFRNNFISLPRAEKERIGKTLGPVLGKCLSAAADNWDTAHEDSQFAEQYSKPLRVCESLLKMILPELGITAPNTDLQNLWDQGEKSRFTEDVVEWKRILDRSPFSN